MYDPYFSPKEYRLTEEQVKEFLTELGNGTYSCKHDHFNAKLVLTSMGITEKDQNKFLEICTYYGGHCDCEIFWNAVDHIESDFQTIFFDYPEEFDDEELFSD